MCKFLSRHQKRLWIDALSIFFLSRQHTKTEKRPVSNLFNLQPTQKLVIAFTSRERSTKVCHFVRTEWPWYETNATIDANPLSQLNPKKKIFETIQPGTKNWSITFVLISHQINAGFTTLESKEAAWIDPATKSVHRLRTKDGVCFAPNFVGASLS